VGGSGDNSGVGAAWVWSRSSGSKLVGSGAVGAAAQGESVALSADGNTAIVGGFEDNSTVGAEECSRRRSNERMDTTWAEGGMGAIVSMSLPS
jgi:hypothetical protein